MHRVKWLGYTISVVLLFTFGTGCKRNTAAHQALLPRYFASMEDGLKHERRGDYGRAIQIYTLALSETDDVATDLRTQSKIAVHNRMAVCYVSPQ